MSSVSNMNAPSTALTSENWQIKLLFDGACPLCVREVNFLRSQDRDRGLIKFVDIAADDYDPRDHGGIDFETAMGRIHAILADGTVVVNVEVFRRVYDILGIGWVYAITKLPLIGWFADFLYGIWADYRLLLTGRGSLSEVMAARAARLAAQDCSDRCNV